MEDVMDEQDATLRIIKYNAMVFDQIFGAFTITKKTEPILPLGDGTANTEPEVEDGRVV
jgi:hypothetical protein